jgi:hypothetical protein
MFTKGISAPGHAGLTAIVSGLATCALCVGLTAASAGTGPKIMVKTANTSNSGQISTAPGRPLPSPLYGVTVDDVSNTTQTVAGLQNLPEAPTTRLYLDVNEPAGYYTAAVNALRPVSYLMGELLYSSDETSISASAYSTRVKSYVAAFGSKVDLWEIGNEVNGNWTGSYPTVESKLTNAYNDVTAAGKRSALTLYYNVRCGDGPAELDPLAFSRKYVPASVRNGLDYVLLSYYEDDCNNIRPSAATWTAYFQQLHVLYPNAQLGFGEVGLNKPATAKNLPAAESLMSYYYGLTISLPYYAGGYFWWNFKEDGLPYATKPLYGVLGNGFQAEAGNWAGTSGAARR